MVKSYKWHKKESLIDHIYVNDITSVSNVKFEVPTFGDHVLAIAELNLSMKHENKNHIVRNWKDYSICSINNTLLSLLGTFNSCNSSTPVQSHWNSLENLLITAIDVLAPLENHITKNNRKSIPNGIKNLINKRILYVILGEWHGLAVSVEACHVTPRVEGSNPGLSTSFFNRRAHPSALSETNFIRETKMFIGRMIK